MLTSLLALAFALASFAPDPKSNKIDAPLPARILEIKARLKGHAYEKVLGILKQELGEPARDVGSGEHIWQWDVAGGVLTFPSLTFEQGNRRHWLIDTRSELGANLIGGWEMTTLPGEFGNCFWIGGVTLHKDGTYNYADSGANPRERQMQKSNFFIQHPKGTFTIEYPKGMDAKTLQETIPKGDTPVATLTFHADGPKEKANAKFTVRSSPSDRDLDLGADGIPFCLKKGWGNPTEAVAP